jgi:hypothetical protein
MKDRKTEKLIHILMSYRDSVLKIDSDFREGTINPEKSVNLGTLAVMDTVTKIEELKP